MAKKKTPNTFSYAPEVAEVARRLIAKHHMHLEHVRIEYVFRTEQQRNGGHPVFATVSKMTGRNAFLATHDERGMEDLELVPDDDPKQMLDFFVLDCHRATWNRLSPQQREALVDHQLCHMALSQTPDGYKLDLKSHDIEEFNVIAHRYGNWSQAVQSFRKAVDGAPASTVQLYVEGEQSASEETPAKRRGRPRKEAQAVAAP